IASFSWLTKQEAEGLPDRDEREDALMEPASGIFAFPKGSRPGTCLHEIFEEIDFASPDEILRAKIVGEKLRNHGFDDKEFSEVVGQAVNNVLTVPLEPGNAALTLSKISTRERLTELEFYFPIQQLSADGLRNVFARRGSGLSKDF